MSSSDHLVPEATLNRAEDPDVIVASNRLYKRYTLYHSPQDRLKQLLFSRLGRSFGHDFWALQDINFTIHRGEIFGVIGRNGSGKSTLLQIIAGILQPTNGSIVVQGRVAALLELGAGFNPEFTGRENILLAGSIHGLSQEEIKAQMSDIIDFADIGEFIDQPVKLYSSGMFVRLAFAVATGVNADILLIDEALAVGDIFFRQKCYRHLETLREKGVSIILVTHSLNEVEQFCEQAILLHSGRAVFVGNAVDAVKRFYLVDQNHDIHQATSESVISAEQPDSNSIIKRPLVWPEPTAFVKFTPAMVTSNGMARCISIAITDASGSPKVVFEQGEKARFFAEFEIDQPIHVPLCGIQIQNEKGIIVHGKTTLEYGGQPPTHVAPGQRIRFQNEIAMEIAIGEYSLEVGFATIPPRDFQLRSSLQHTTLYSRVTRILTVTNLGPIAVVARQHWAEAQLSHHGVANLPGTSYCEIL